MRRFIGFVKKEFLHIFRDARTMVILFGIPAAQIIIFGYAVTTDIKDAGIAIVDMSDDEITREITSKISSSDFFIFKEKLQSVDQIDEVFKKGEVKAILVFEEDFGKNLIKTGEAKLTIVADGSEPNVANLVTSYARSILNNYMQEYLQTGSSNRISITPEVRMFYNPNLESQFMFVPGIITLVLVLICALMTSVTITREKEFGTMEVLLVSPLKPLQIILGKVTPYFFLSLIDLGIILLLSWLVFGLPVQGSILLLMGVTMIYIMLSLTLGILISIVSKTMQQAIFISLLGLMLPTVVLSGFIFPIEYMPEIYQYVSAIMPPRWFVNVIKGIMVKGTGIIFIWKEILILTGMTLFLIVLSVKKFKTRLE
ncbi:MAG: ABC transporter permease [Bacteroidales bacterium]|nr:ABC transporter permease [Bacteroidales bacterium]